MRGREGYFAQPMSKVGIVCPYVSGCGIGSSMETNSKGGANMRKVIVAIYQVCRILLAFMSLRRMAGGGTGRKV